MITKEKSVKSAQTKNTPKIQAVVKTEGVVIDKKNKVAKKSQYALSVLDFNAELKSYKKSFGGCRQFLINAVESGQMTMDVKMYALLNQSKTNKETFENILKNTRTSKTGNYSPFYVLQALYKMTK